MPKKTMTDIVARHSSTRSHPATKRLPHSRNQVDDFFVPPEEDDRIEEHLELMHFSARKNKKGLETEMSTEGVDVYADNSDNSNKKALWLIALISIGALFFAISSFFTSATVTITPKSKDFSIDELFSANYGTTKETEIPFESVSIDGTESSLITVAEKKEFNSKATGQVVLYNNYSSTPQKLLIDTRLVGSNGKVYKTEKAVTIPGMNGTVPGKIIIGIYAQEAGEEYNSGPIKFKVFGFRGTTKYDKFYGESVGNISGGNLGTKYTVPEEEKTATTSELANKLQEKLTKKIFEQIPSGYILYKDALLFKSYEPTVNPGTASEATQVSLSGTAYGFLFKEKDLINRIAKIFIPEYEGEELKIPNLAELNFVFGNKDDLSKDSRGFNFKLSGSGQIVYAVNETAIVQKLLGQPKENFKKILAEEKNIESAELVVRPVWISELPEKPKKIKIIINYPK